MEYEVYRMKFEVSNNACTLKLLNTYLPLTFDHAAMKLYTFCVEPIEVLKVFNQSRCNFFKLKIRTAVEINDSFHI